VNPVPPATDGNPPRAAPVRGQAISRRRRWCFRLVALVLPLAGLGAIEGVLRWTGSGADLTLVERSPPGVCRFNPHVDSAYYGLTDLSGPEPRPFLLPKPAGTFRIVVVGGSTVQGFPYAPELAFPRFVEYLLRQQSADRQIEVLNAGITAINSFAEADLVEEALHCDPDLIVVYTGHNEFVGPGGVGSAFGGVPPRWSPFVIALRRTRTYQVLAGGLTAKLPPQRELMDELPGDLKIEMASDKFRRAERHLHDNLERMIEVCVRARIPLLLTSPITNLRHQSPMESLSSSGLAPGARDEWREAVERGAELAESGKVQEALAAYDLALERDAGHALTVYRRAQCLERLDRWDEALLAYERAADLDACRFRAPSTFRRIIENAAGAAHSDSVRFVDTFGEFSHGIPHEIPGNESFLEHVHFTYDGNWRLAVILAKEIAARYLHITWNPDLVPADAERDALCGVTPQDHLVAASLVLTMLERPPLKQGADVRLQVAAVSSDLPARLGRLAPVEQEVFGDLSLQQMQSDLVGALLARYATRRLDREEVELLRRAIKRQPWRADWHVSLAQWEFGHGNIEAALQNLDEAVKWDPASARAEVLRDQIERRGREPHRN
jgi:tetratricopeptide (TPR) repeat protein